jgi:Trk K+ transport system NAD-binding subunit
MSRTAIVAGPDPEGLVDALETEGVDVVRITDTVSASTLDDAGIDAVDLLVLTDVAEATGISVAKDRNPDVRAVVYSRESLPEFAKGQADLAVDPALLAAEVVAEELAAEG